MICVLDGVRARFAVRVYIQAFLSEVEACAESIMVKEPHKNFDPGSYWEAPNPVEDMGVQSYFCVGEERVLDMVNEVLRDDHGDTVKVPRVLLPYLVEKDLDPQAFRLVHNSPGKTQKDKLVFKVGSLDAKTTIPFRESHLFPRDHVHLPFLISRSPNEVPNNSVNMIQNLFRNKDVLHDMVGDVAKAHIPLYLYPFLNTTSKSRPFEYLRLTSLGVIGALVKVDDTEVISFLLSTEIIPLCLRTMEMGSELSKTVATFIVQKILLDDVDLDYICTTAERACDALRTCLPDMLRDTTFSSCLRESNTRQT
ncbi:Cell differentiation protein RCD1 -like protein [Capsicum baccatum]|uniref:Cell differentiation protein RCD1-like protein n=1 Tax=Capsicum baccatum TaxID=33114 RepID=A0A2G2VRF1_CAPBA|nr:Cell differentiation protein RCD1 -like protein [Capsicum baccatum]